MSGGDLLDEPVPTGQWNEYRRDVQRVLALARHHLEMDVAWVSEFDGGEQIFRAVDDGGTGFGPPEGSGSSLRDSYCLRVVDGRLPSVVGDARHHPVTRDLPGTKERNIGSYVGVPIRQENSVIGMLCCADPLPRTDLGQHEVSTLGMLAALLGDLLARSSSTSRQRDAIQHRISCAIAGHGVRIALQPIIATASGRLRGAEALARFGEVQHPAPAGPGEWFADAEAVGLRAQLETTAASLALARLDELADDARLTINVSPDLVVAGALNDLLPGRDLARLVVEITEHAPVPDYGSLHRALDPHREHGLKLAVDDAGAGYASFRHILNLRPDLIKMDISLVRDIDRDPAQQALVDSLLSFSDRSGAVLLAEGVERQGELDELARLGVPLVQGFLLGRPTLSELPRTYPRPTVL